MFDYVNSDKKVKVSQGNPIYPILRQNRYPNTQNILVTRPPKVLKIKPFETPF